MTDELYVQRGEVRFTLRNLQELQPILKRLGRLELERQEALRAAMERVGRRLAESWTPGLRRFARFARELELELRAGDVEDLLPGPPGWSRYTLGNAEARRDRRQNGAQ